MFVQGMIDSYGLVLLFAVLLVVGGAVYGLTYPEEPDGSGYRMGQSREQWAASQKIFARALMASGGVLLVALTLLHLLAQALGIDNGARQALAIALLVAAIIGALVYTEVKRSK